MAVLTQSLMKKGPCDLHLFPQHIFRYSLLISIKFFNFLKNNNNKKINSLTRRLIAHQEREKKWYLITNSRCLKMHVYLFSVWNIFKKPSNHISAVFFPMTWFCPSVLPFRRRSHRMKITWKGSFSVSTPALIILQILTIKKNLPELCLASKQRNDIFHLLSIMGHLVPSWKENSGRHFALLPPHPPSCPHSAGARCNNYVHLICIHPKPCSKKGEKLQATGNQIRKILWIATDHYSYKVTDSLYEVLLRLTVPALGFCRSSLDKVVIIAAEEGILLKSAYTECSLLS